MYDMLSYGPWGWVGENRDNAWQSGESHGRGECCHTGPDMGEQLCLCGRDASTVAESLSSGNSLPGYLQLHR